MTAQSVRMMKEVRLLIWPWLAVTVTAASVLAFAALSADLRGYQEVTSMLCQIGIFAGLPLLAALSLGAEFQYNTVGLNFAQPIERSEIWRAKFTLTVLALLPPGVLFVASQRLSAHFDRNSWLMLIGWLIVTSAAAFPWTLIARSTVGGFALNAGSSTIAFMTITFAAESFRNEGGLSVTTTMVIALALFCYSVAMVWFGRRMFLRFQAVGGFQSAEAALPGAHLFPRAFADWFRSRPHGLFLNLIRREFRLLRFVWPLTLLSVVAWLFVLKVHALPASDTKPYLLPVLALTVMIGLLIAVLAGSLSVGEEKSWGTHDWHLTLPISPSVLWFVKLSMSIVTSVICSALVPLAILVIAGWRMGNVYFYAEKTTLWFIPLQAAGLTFVAFWCACIVKGTVRAALLTFPAMMTIFAGAPLGTWLGEVIGERSKPFFDLLATRWGIVTITTHTTWLERMFYMPEQLVLFLMAPLFGLALLQSRRMFREQAGEGAARILRRLRPMFVMTLGSALAFTLFFMFCFRASERAGEAAWQLNVAIQTLHPNASGNGAPIHVSAKELARLSPLTADTEHWLGDANILIVPGPPTTLYGAWGVAFGNGRRLTSGEQWQPYSAVVRLENNTTCFVMFQVSLKFRWAYTRAICN